MTAADRVLAEARSWVGRQFAPGEMAQCANFVRAMFGNAGVDVGSSQSPDDAHLIPYEPVASSYANSFAGDSVGKKISNTGNLLPGDIIMFRNTYGSWPQGVITHVGIYEGNGYFIHRPTSARPVERGQLAGFWASLFAQGRRPHAYTEESRIKPKQYTIKKFSHDGSHSIISGDPIPLGSYSLISEDSWMDLEGYDGKIKVFLNGNKHVIHIPGDLKAGIYNIVAESSTMKAGKTNA